MNNESIRQEFSQDKLEKKQLNKYSKLRECIEIKWLIKERVQLDDKLNNKWWINKRETYLDKWENEDREKWILIEIIKNREDSKLWKKWSR